MDYRPEVPLADDLVGKGTRARVIATNVFMDLPKDVVAFLWREAPKVREIEATFVKGTVDDQVSGGTVANSFCLSWVSR